jgi:O-methyltransferase involved in polyketide biosynthesis
MEKLKLEPTSALMMQWGRKAFHGEVIESFIEHLDLSSGKELYEQCNSVCDWYDEVVVNRKYFINHFIDRKLKSSDEEHLIILLAAGESPHSLQFLIDNPEKVNKIIEIDNIGMDEKKELYDLYYPQHSYKIKCITADITSNSILSVLNSLVHEYYREIPCIIVLEGVSFYLSLEEQEKIISSFVSQKKNNTFIIEYLVPIDNVCEERKYIPEAVFEIIREKSGLEKISTNTFEDISAIFSKYGGTFLKKCTLMEIEKDRLGKNIYFNKPDDGWIECSVWQI